MEKLQDLTLVQSPIVSLCLIICPLDWMGVYTFYDEDSTAVGTMYSPFGLGIHAKVSIFTALNVENYRKVSPVPVPPYPEG